MDAYGINMVNVMLLPYQWYKHSWSTSSPLSRALQSSLVLLDVQMNSESYSFCYRGLDNQKIKNNLQKVNLTRA